MGWCARRAPQRFTLAAPQGEVPRLPAPQGGTRLGLALPLAGRSA